MTKPKTANKEPEKKIPEQEQEQEQECRYVAHCTEDGVCEYPTIYMDEE